MPKFLVASVIAVAAAVLGGCGQGASEVDVDASEGASLWSPAPSTPASADAEPGAPLRLPNATGDGFTEGWPIDGPTSTWPSVSQSVRDVADAAVRNWEPFAALSPEIEDVAIDTWLDINGDLYGLILQYTLAEQIDIPSGGPAMQWGPPAIEAGVAYIPIIDSFAYVGVSKLTVWYDLVSDSPVGFAPREMRERIVPPDFVSLDPTSERPDD